MLRRMRLAAAATTAAWLAASLAGLAGAAEPGARAERQAVIDRIVAATARVSVERGGKVVNSGSGVAIAAGRDAGGAEVSYLLTAAHALEGAEGGEVVVRFTGEHAGRKLLATIVKRGRPEQLDLALLRVTGLAAPVVPLGSEREPRLGEEIFVVGFPWGKRLGLYSGVVSQIPLDAAWPPAPGDASAASLMVDAAVAKGVSGGGVFRLDGGELIGIVEASQTTTVSVRGRTESYSVKVPMPGETFVVPLQRIGPFLDEAAPDLATVLSTR
ncbi:MAG: serine protease [Candidatus Methylomirabilales bacterium]